MKRFFLYFIYSMFILSACAPKVNFKDPQQSNFEGFGPTTEDKEVNLHNVMGIDALLSLNHSGQAPLVDNSPDIFRLADETLSYQTNDSDKKVLDRFGHNILISYYDNNQNATQFGATNSSYLEAAIAFEGMHILEYFKSLVSDQSIEKLREIILGEAMQFPSPESPQVHYALPKRFVKTIKDYLYSLKEQMDGQNINKSIVDGFWLSVQKNFLTALNQASNDLDQVGPDKSLHYNRETIKNVIGNLTFLPSDMRGDISRQLADAEVYENLLYRTNSPDSKADDLLQLVARIWLRLDETGRETYIESANEGLFQLLKTLGSDRLNIDDRIYYLAGLVQNCGPHENPKPGYKCFQPGYISQAMHGILIKQFNESCFDAVKSGIETFSKEDESTRAQSFKKAYPDLYTLFNRPVNGSVISKDDFETILAHWDDLFTIVPSTVSLMNGFKQNAHSVCIRRLQVTLESAIKSFILSKLDVVIRQQGKNIQNTVLNMTLKNLLKLKDNTERVSDFVSFFSKSAYPEISRIIFQNTDSLPAIERANVGLFINQSGKFESRPIGSVTNFVTGAETLGTSLSAAYQRFLGLSRVENLDPTSAKYYQVVFGQINKMLAMLGFRKLDDKMFQSLGRPFTSSIPELDVYKYACSTAISAEQNQRKAMFAQSHDPKDEVLRLEDCNGYEKFETSYFAIPDKLQIEGSFTPEDSLPKTLSVRSQAEIIRGASAMLKYFKDWKTNTDEYDLGLQKLDYKGFRLLPRDAIVNLSIGILSVPLRNFKRPNSTLVIFDQWGHEVKSNQISTDPNNPQWKVTAAITDLTETGPSRIVKSEDLADLIIAIDEFADATEGIENSKASVITPKNNSERKNLAAIQEGKKLLLQMMVGLSNFITSRFQDKDGGFWSTYDLDQNKLVNTESLRMRDTQVLISQALLRTYRRWGSEGAKWAAVDGYFFMNRKLWDDTHGFYRVSEGARSFDIKPHMLVRTLKLLKDLSPLIPKSSSSSQTSQIYDVWYKKWVDWAKTTVE